MKSSCNYFSASRNFCVLVLIATQFIFCSPSPSKAADILKIGVITVGPAEDYGYNYCHNVARLYVQSHLPNVQTTLVEKIPESSEAERVMEKMVAQGNRLIFSTSYGYLEPAERVAKRHPDVIIMQTWRPSTTKNVGMFAAYKYQALYAVGVVVGRMTKKNQVGLVCAHPVPVLLQDINAFTLGAHPVNPKVKVHIVWTNSWSDPATEAEATKGLVEQGMDVIGCILDGPLTVTQVAEKNHVMVFGAEADLSKFVPEEWLTGSLWNWNKIYLQIAKSVQGGTWRKECYWLGMKDDAVELCSFGKLVPKAVQAEASSIAQKIKNGKFIIFKGPLKDREGKTRLAAGKLADDQWLSQMNFFVDGVEGNLPK